MSFPTTNCNWKWVESAIASVEFPPSENFYWVNKCECKKQLGWFTKKPLLRPKYIGNGIKHGLLFK